MTSLILIAMWKKVSKVEVYLKEVQSAFEECFKRCYKVLCKFQWCFKENRRKLLETYKGHSREFQGNLKEVQTGFQGSFKGVQFVSGKFQKLSRMFL